MTRAAPPGASSRLRGDAVLAGLLLADFMGAIAASLVFLTMVWWVLRQDPSDLVFGLMMLAIIVPLNIGVLLSGPAVARVGARRLVLWSKGGALTGAGLCLVLMTKGWMTLPLLALIAAMTYGALGPSVTADVSRAPAITRLAGRRLIDFNAANGLAMLLGAVLGFWLAGRFNDTGQSAASLALGAACIVGSILATWAAFPRDRKARAFDGTSAAHLRHLLRAVLQQVRKTPMVRAMATQAALLLAISGVYEDIVLPLTLREAGLAPSTHSAALIASVIAGALVSLLAPVLHRHIGARPVFLLCTFAALGVLLLHLAAPGPGVFIVVVLVIALCAGLTAMLGFTTMQEAMPVSLQAQAAGVWHSFVMTLGSVCLLAGGILGTASLLLLAALATLAALLATVSRFDDAGSPTSPRTP